MTAVFVDTLSPTQVVAAESATEELVVSVVGYREAAMRDTLDEGFAVYDATDLMVIKPKEHAGMMVLYHSMPKPKPVEIDWREDSLSDRSQAIGQGSGACIFGRR
ncbi:MAG: hypothetical protein KDB00_07920 [Planctomycetales bacterium]|nr:hypothetical protein [Planctomycetales bacterium]